MLLHSEKVEEKETSEESGETGDNIFVMAWQPARAPTYI